MLVSGYCLQTNIGTDKSHDSKQRARIAHTQVQTRSDEMPVKVLVIASLMPVDGNIG